MQYSLLKYPRRLSNLGDYIQSLAARQFLPRVDQFISRERLSEYKGDATKLILNGWFSHSPHCWPPAPGIIPLFISFHLNAAKAQKFLTPANIQYLKSWQPIGCRDFYTAKLLSDHGIESYFSGCLTLTLSSYRCETRADSEILFVDIPSSASSRIASHLFNPKSSQSVFDPILINEAKKITHKPSILENYPKASFVRAESLLRRYSQARAVVTTRIHCVLPCLALGTPVIFINADQRQAKTCRYGGITNLMNTVNIDSQGLVELSFETSGLISKYNFPPNPSDYLALTSSLADSANKFISWY